MISESQRAMHRHLSAKFHQPLARSHRARLRFDDALDLVEHPALVSHSRNPARGILLWQRLHAQRAGRRPAAVPSMMPATATNDASASVDRPVSPCPIEQPKRHTPPVPISAAPPAERSHVARRLVALEMKAPGQKRGDEAAGEHAEHGDDTEIKVDPGSTALTYCRRPAIGAMKVQRDHRRTGFKSSAPR